MGMSDDHYRWMDKSQSCLYGGGSECGGVNGWGDESLCTLKRKKKK